MKAIRILLSAFLAFAFVYPQALTAATVQIPKGIAGEQSASALNDGAYSVYYDLTKYKRIDLRIAQDGGSGTSSFQIFASWDNDGNYSNKETLTYDDIGLDFYGAATFTDATVRLIDNGEKLKGVTWVKVTFTIAGAASDASYNVKQIRITPRV